VEEANEVDVPESAHDRPAPGTGEDTRAHSTLDHGGASRRRHAAEEQRSRGDKEKARLLFSSAPLLLCSSLTGGAAGTRLALPLTIPRGRSCRVGDTSHWLWPRGWPSPAAARSRITSTASSSSPRGRLTSTGSRSTAAPSAPPPTSPNAASRSKSSGRRRRP